MNYFLLTILNIFGLFGLSYQLKAEIQSNDTTRPTEWTVEELVDEMLKESTDPKSYVGNFDGKLGYEQKKALENLNQQLIGKGVQSYVFVIENTVGSCDNIFANQLGVIHAKQRHI